MAFSLMVARYYDSDFPNSVGTGTIPKCEKKQLVFAVAGLLKWQYT